MNWWRHRYTWATVAFIGVVIGNSGGLAIGDDGVGYEAVSTSIRTGHGLGYFLERPLTIWPPGWPALMALVSKVTTLNPEGAAILLNALTAAVLVILVNRILTRLLRTDQLILAGTAVVSIGASSMVFGHLLMTDFAFAAITMGAILALMNFRDAAASEGSGIGWLVAASALIGIGFLIRYAGIITIVTGVWWLMIDARRRISLRARDTAVFAVLSAAVPIGWMLRNHAVDGTLLGVRYGSARGLLGNVFDTVATIGNFLTPGVAIDLRVVWAAVALIGTAVMLAMGWRVVRTDERFRSIRGLLAVAATGAGLLAAHAVIYLLYMLYARTTTGLNQLDFRLLNPAYLPLVGVALVILDRIIDAGTASVARSATNPNVRTPVPQKWSTAARWTAGLWAATNLAMGVAMVVYFSTSPDLFVGNYERPAFVTARASRALAELDPSCALSSNLPNGLYGDGVEAQWSPRITGPESDDKVDDIARMKADLAANHRHCLAWVALEPRWGHLATLAQLRKEFALVELNSDSGVTTYEIRPLPS